MTVIVIGANPFPSTPTWNVRPRGPASPIGDEMRDRSPVDGHATRDSGALQAVLG